MASISGTFWTINRFYLRPYFLFINKIVNLNKMAFAKKKKKKKKKTPCL